MFKRTHHTWSDVEDQLMKVIEALNVRFKDIDNRLTELEKAKPTVINNYYTNPIPPVFVPSPSMPWTCSDRTGGTNG